MSGILPGGGEVVKDYFANNEKKRGRGHNKAQLRFAALAPGNFSLV